MTPRRNAAIALAGLCAALLAAIALRAWLRHHRALDAETLRLQSELRRARSLALRSDALHKRASAFATESASALTPEAESLRLLKEVETLARSASLPLRRLQPLPRELKGNRARYTVEAEAAGSLDRIADFLARVESSSGRLRVSRFSISASGPELAARFTLSRSVFVPTPL